MKLQMLRTAFKEKKLSALELETDKPFRIQRVMA